MHTATISTERLILKGVNPKLIHQLFTEKSQEDIQAFLGIDAAGYQHYKSMHEQGMETHRYSLFFFLLINKISGQVMGDCGFHTLNQTHKRAELFYGMRSDAYKQQGFMKEALKPILEYGFNQLGLHRIQALVGAENTPSLKLIRHFDFKFEGTLREDYVINGKSENSECFSLLAWEWRNNSLSST